MTIRRLILFSFVGLFATVVHASASWNLLRFGHPLWISNAVGFLCAFLVSFVLQQRFTFGDRLRGKTLSSRDGLAIFAINLFFSLIFSTIRTPLSFLLPLMPAMVNFVMYYWLSGLPQFRGDNNPGA